MTDTTHAATTPLNIETNRYSIEEKMKTLKERACQQQRRPISSFIFDKTIQVCIEVSFS